MIVRDLGGERCCFIIPIEKTLEKSAQVALRQGGSGSFLVAAK